MYKKKLSLIKDYWVRNPCEEWFFGSGISCKDIDKIDLKQFKYNLTQAGLNNNHTANIA